MERDALRVALKKKLSHVKTVGFAGCSAAFFELFSCQSSSSSLLQGMRWKWDFEKKLCHTELLYNRLLCSPPSLSSSFALPSGDIVLEKKGCMCSFVTTTSGFLRNTSCACTFASSSGSGLDVSIHKVSKSTKAVKQMLFMFPFLHLDISSQLSCICIKGILNTSSKHTLHLPSCSLRISLHFCHFAHLQRHI